MNSLKYMFYAMIACVAVVALSGRMFAAETSESRILYAQFKVLDERPAGSLPTAQEFGERFRMALLPVDKKPIKDEMPENRLGNGMQEIGSINKDTTFIIFYRSPNGAVTPVRNLGYVLASKDAMIGPVTFSDKDGNNFALAVGVTSGGGEDRFAAVTIGVCNGICK